MKKESWEEKFRGTFGTPICITADGENLRWAEEGELEDFILKTRLDAQKEILEELWIFGKGKKGLSLLLLCEFANSIGIALSE